MEELNKYVDSIIGLYQQGFSISYISNFLYLKVNTKLKTFNKQSNGELWVSIPKVSKADCQGFVYNIIYKNIMKKFNGGN